MFEELAVIYIYKIPIYQKGDCTSLIVQSSFFNHIYPIDLAIFQLKAGLDLYFVLINKHKTSDGLLRLLMDERYDY